jgi:lysophospholipase L1-like esterase
VVVGHVVSFSSGSGDRYLPGVRTPKRVATETKAGNDRGVTRPLLVAALGDSITAGTPFWDPDPEIRAAIGPELDERHQWGYWAERAYPGIRMRNHGVNGERTDQIAARLDEAIEGADVLIVQGGINDIAQGRPLERALANLADMVARGRAAGLPVALANLLPWNNGFPAKDPLIRELNAGIAALAAARSVELLDFFATLEDPERPGTMPDEWTSEGDHPSLDGYRRLGELAFRLPF